MPARNLRDRTKKVYPKLADLFAVFRMPQGVPPIDIRKLKADLAKLAPKAPAPQEAWVASCEHCGWASSPADSREELEDILEQDDCKVTYGGPKLLATCPFCFGPLSSQGGSGPHGSD